MGDTYERDSFPVAESPFTRAGLGRRLFPFAAVAVLAYASLALPSGPKSMTDTIVAGALLVLVGAACLLPWDRISPVLTVLVPLMYTGSVLMLILATGGSTSGIGIVILIPLIWTSLYHRRWESFSVVLGIVAVEVITSLTPLRATDAVILRRVIFWAALGGLVSVASHDLRDRVSRTLVTREELHRRTAALEAAAEELTFILRPDEILTTATRLAAEMLSRPGRSERRAHYTRIDGDTATVVAEYDESGGSGKESFLLADHPNLREAVSTGQAIQLPLDPDAAGPSVRQLIERLGATHSVYVPVMHDGEIDGVLSVPLLAGSASPELFEQCKAIGHLIELALSNALAHEALLALATTDPLTGLPNRRGFEQLVDNRPGRYSFAMLAVDLDGLKQVNDSGGHAAGDALLSHVAETISLSLRRGDVLSRFGGDEFAVLLFGADASDARRAAERLLDALAAAPFRGISPSVSVGIAVGAADSRAAEVYEAADAAMYEAKRRGGRRYALARSSPGENEEMRI